MDSSPDKDLVSACRKGDRAAYSFLVQRHYKRVFAVCFGIVGNVQDAEDIAQDAMLRGFLKIMALRRNERFGPWILRIAKNLSIDLLRRQRHVKTILTGQVSVVRKKQGHYDLQQAVRDLLRELRLPLVMYYFGNKNVEGIAEDLRISRTGVFERLRAARKQLHELLTREVQNGP